MRTVVSSAVRDLALIQTFKTFLFFFISIHPQNGRKGGDINTSGKKKKKNWHR